MPKYPDAAKDPYLDPASGILRNRLGITDQAQLDRAEATFAAVRSYEMETAAPANRFDLMHLQAVHGRLFGDVYPWAGELRSVEISKGGTKFALPQFIESGSAGLFRSLDREQNLRGLEADAFSQRAGHYLGEINALHPFREGNGRAQRAFINEIARGAGYRVAWRDVSREDMTRASIAAFNGDSGPLADLIRRNLTDFDRERAHALARDIAGDRAQVDRAEPGHAYAGRVIGATERYIVQERAGKPGEMVLHSRRSVDGQAEKMQGQNVEIRYPHGNIGLVRQMDREQGRNGPDKGKDYGRERG